MKKVTNKTESPPKGVSMDSFISKIVNDPQLPIGVIKLNGYIGNAFEKDHIRLYSDLSLRQFIEIPHTAIVYSAKISENDWGGSHLWVDENSTYLVGLPSGTTRISAVFSEKHPGSCFCSI